MTATPIPRTLGQVLYADLDVSTLRTAPAGRVPIRTGIRRPDELEGTWDRVRDGGRRGPPDVRGRAPDRRRDGDADDGADGAGDLRATTSCSTRTSRRPGPRRPRRSTSGSTALLAPLRVGLVHGRLKPADRDAEMARFRDGDLDVLVGTTVVEVGVDVPEATMMVVEGADRFGLAQLHQLRGRVGRGDRGSVLRPRLRGGGGHDRARAARRRWPRRPTGSRSPSGTSSCGARATCSASPRAGCRACGSRRSRTATTASSPPGPGARRGADRRGRRVADGGPALARELAAGWLRSVFAGDPASAPDVARRTGRWLTRAG